jgi:EPS-associated MarR family transcriptional regulator
MPEFKHILPDEARYRLLKLLSAHPGMSQRDLAAALDISLGKTNYCMRALIERGWVKVINFRNSRHKAGYLYQLTPNGLAEKARATHLFLIRKLEEYEQLETEIAELRDEVSIMELSQGAQPE